MEKDIAVLEYRIEVLEKELSEESKHRNTKYHREIELLETAINKLKLTRLSENEEIIKTLESLILEELKDLGIPNVSEVKIGENFKAKFMINGVYSDFDAVSEGEQLRLKLALYLGLIQLNIQSGQGKHPKFLVIDSPTKEEGDKGYIHGLQKVIEEVSTKYGQNLQIIICTAERDLQNVNINGQKYIYPENEFLF